VEVGVSGQKNASISWAAFAPFEPGEEPGQMPNLSWSVDVVEHTQDSVPGGSAGGSTRCGGVATGRAEPSGHLFGHDDDTETPSSRASLLVRAHC